MTRTIKLTREPLVEETRKTPQYVSYGRGVCRATGGMAHQVVDRIDSKGRHYSEDTVTGKRVIFEKSIAQRTRDHEAKVMRRVSNLCHKAETIGLTGNEFETLHYLNTDECIQSNWEIQNRINRTLTGQQYDAGKIVSRRTI